MTQHPIPDGPAIPDGPKRQAALDRARALLDAYGAARSRWPQEARDLYDDLQGDASFEALRREAAALDGALDGFNAPRAGEALEARLLDSLPAAGAARPASRLSSVFGVFGGRRLLPAGALAGLSALGFATGMMTAGASASDEALVFAEAAVSATFEEEDAFWAVEEE